VAGGSVGGGGMGPHRTPGPPSMGADNEDSLSFRPVSLLAVLTCVVLVIAPYLLLTYLVFCFMFSLGLPVYHKTCFVSGLLTSFPIIFLQFYLCRVFTFLVGACAAVFQLCRRRGQCIPSEEDAIGKSSSTCHGCQGLCPSCPSLPTGVSLTCFFLFITYLFFNFPCILLTAFLLTFRFVFYVLLSIVSVLPLFCGVCLIALTVSYILPVIICTYRK